MVKTKEENYNTTGMNHLKTNLTPLHNEIKEISF